MYASGHVIDYDEWLRYTLRRYTVRSSWKCLSRDEILRRDATNLVFVYVHSSIKEYTMA